MNSKHPLFAKLYALDPSLTQAFRLPSSSIHLCRTDKKEANLCLEDTSHHYDFHSSYGARQEALDWFESLPLEGVAILYIFGIGLGYYYEAARDWLHASPERRLVFLENRLEVLPFLIDTPLGNALLEDRQVDIRNIGPFQEDPKILYELTWDYALQPYFLTALTSYKKHQESFFSILERQLHFQSHQRNVFCKEKLEYGANFYENFYHNLLELPSAYLGEKLFGKFKNVPAIICGAGPSLEKHLDLLPALKDKALILAPGSAMNILNAHNIYPHLGVAVDPNPETFFRIATNRAFETPFFYRNRLQYEALKAIHGPHILIPGAAEYAVTQWFEKTLGISSHPFDLDEGYNVVNLAIDIAYYLGCNPLIFIGMDLSSSSDKHYAKGLEKHPFQSHSRPPNSQLGEPITVLDLEGKPVQTYWPWIAEANWISYFSTQHPETTLFNATEGGIGLFTVPNLSFKEAAENCLYQNQDIQSQIFAALEQAALTTVSLEKVVEALEAFEASIKRCEVYCQKQIALLQEGSQPSLLASSLGNEIAFEYVLKDFNDFFSRFNHRIEKELHRQSLSTLESSFIYKQLTLQRYLFLWQTLKVQSKIIENVKSEASSRIAPSIGQKASCQIFKENPGRETHTYYYRHGQLKSVIPYWNGVLHGQVKLYYPNGQVKRELTFEKGERHGIEKSWYDNGQLFTQIDYKNGVAQAAKCWLKDGTLIVNKEEIE